MTAALAALSFACYGLFVDAGYYRKTTGMMLDM
jgi:hypothetical protein